MIKVVNRKNFYGKGVYIGRPSPLGNPFVIGRDGDREKVIEKYREYLKKAIKYDGRVKSEFERIKELNTKGDVILICWCAPQKCHGDVVRELIENNELR